MKKELSRDIEIRCRQNTDPIYTKKDLQLLIQWIADGENESIISEAQKEIDHIEPRSLFLITQSILDKFLLYREDVRNGKL